MNWRASAIRGFLLNSHLAQEMKFGGAGSGEPVFAPARVEVFFMEVALASAARRRPALGEDAS
jgi:hypothetical protein